MVRERNFYRDGDETHYGEPVRDAERIELIWNALKDIEQLSTSAATRSRGFNARSVHHKRGLAMTPVKFGISFTASFYNQAGAVVLVYRDGTVQVNHGGTEMGQGLFTKILQIAADSLGVPASRVRVMSTRTDKVPEHLGDSGLLRQRPQRCGGAGRVPADQSAAGRGRGGGARL